jgi:hypothetical protein
MARSSGSRSTRPDTAPLPVVQVPERPPPHRDRLLLLLAAGAVLLFYFSARWSARQPWSYDEYYHVGLAREMGHQFFLKSFPWTPFSILSAHFADKEPLFHLLLMPFSGLSLETATLCGVLIGQLLLIGSFVLVLRWIKAPHAYAFMLALTMLGSLVAMRVDMCRPHLLLMTGAVLILGALAAERRPWELALIALLFSWAHAGAWIAIAEGAVWALAGVFAAPPTSGRRVPWRPVLWIAAGWLLGQILHPSFPDNWRLFIFQNFVVPFEASPAGNEALRSQIGEELSPPTLAILFEQWTAFLAPLLATFLLWRHPHSRRRAPLAAIALSWAFLIAGSVLIRRFLELGAPLSVLALALVVAAASDRPIGPLRSTAARSKRDRPADPQLLLGGWGPWILPLFLVIGAAWTGWTVRSYSFGNRSGPREMALSMGANAPAGARVFTAQWADSAPLFYSAPQLKSLVALDPTFFFAQDPDRFAEYVRIVSGRHPDPRTAIQKDFGARYVTLWRVPVYAALVGQLQSLPVGHPPPKVAYADSDYLVLDLSQQ